jgi:nucleoside-diphosphate-sugar epimerase
MPAITDTRAAILLSGANGFIATWAVDILLRRGYSVRAVVRAEAKGKHLLGTYKSYGDKLQVCIVGDIAKVLSSYSEFVPALILTLHIIGWGFR